MEKVDNKAIGQRLEKIESDRQFKSRRAYALAVGADPSFWDKIVKGNAALPESYVNLLRTKFGVNKEWLIFGKGEQYAIESKKVREKGEPATNEVNFESKYYEVLERERKALEDDKAFFKEILRSSLAVILQEAQRLASRQKGTGEVVLHALERIEGKEKGQLVTEADKRIFQIDKEVHAPDNEGVPHR